ncbi:hypothetical protein LZ30DRAFT_610875 [Colletotrichum cereale]|nr:hypothetical protein LZ30DRAFT_610875 [Colletotrichum cereale]
MSFLSSHLRRYFRSPTQSTHTRQQALSSPAHEIENDALISKSTLDITKPEKQPISTNSRAIRIFSTLWRLLKIIPFLAVAVYIALPLLYVHKFIKTDKAEFSPHPVNCGHDTTSAREAGCVYDIMMVGWTAPDCVDPYVLSDSLSNASELADVGGAGHFTFSVTPDFTDVVQHDVDSITQHDWLYATWEFHKAHCAYVWRVLANALERKRKGEANVYIYRTLVTYEHAVHCSHVLLERNRSLTAPTKIQISGTNRCVLL